MNIKTKSPVIVVGEDDMAFVFTTPDERLNRAESNQEKAAADAPGLADRLLLEFKSFLPTVTRIRPVEAVIAAGKPVRLAAPEYTA